MVLVYSDVFVYKKTLCRFHFSIYLESTDIPVWDSNKMALFYTDLHIYTNSSENMSILK